MDERKGFLTPEQEKKLDSIIKLKGLAEAADGPAITLADNQGLDRIKKSIEDQYPGAIILMYEVVDTIFATIPDME
jgi:hypothetical protein